MASASATREQRELGKGSVEGLMAAETGAILLNIPGTAANAAACLDGYALARQGQAGRAMGIATTGSVTGSLFGVVCLALFTPLLGEVALAFGAFEFFWLAVFGVMMSGQVTGEDALKGWIMGFVGLFVALVGQDGIHAYNRFTFNINDLAGGFSLIPMLVGAFGFAEVLTAMKDKMAPPALRAFDSVLPRFGDVLRYWKTVIRSGVIGASMSEFCRASARTWPRGRLRPSRAPRRVSPCAPPAARAAGRRRRARSGRRRTRIRWRRGGGSGCRRKTASRRVAVRHTSRHHMR